MKFDFHVHSVYSDGSSTLEEIFTTSKVLGLAALSITDHDTVLGLGEADMLSKRYELPFIPGIELTVVERGTKFHVLGYGIDYKSSELIKYSERLLRYLNEKSRKQIKLMQQNGISIEEREFFKRAQGGPLYRAKMLQTLSDFGYLKENEIMTSLERYFSQGAPYYIEDTFKYYDFHKAYKIIKENRGIIVLAHPGKLKKKDERLYREILNSNLLDGVEIYHIANDIEVKKELTKLAIDKKLIVTGGSDYHGIYNKNKTPICGINVPKQVYKHLYPFLKNKI